MAFLFHVQLVLGYISFVFATILLIWSLRNEGRGVILGSIVGIIVMIFSIGSIACAGYYGIKYLNAGVFELTHFSSQK